MIELPENVSIDMSKISRSKDLKDLWDNENDAFIYGLYNSRVINYLNNANIRKRNYTLYSQYTSLMKDTLDYRKSIQKLIDDYDSDGSAIGLANYVVNNIECPEEDKLKIAFVMGMYVRYNLKK